MMKDAFHFILKAVFVLKVSKFLSRLFRHKEKHLEKKDNINFEFYDATTWLTNNYNTNIAQYLTR